MKRADALRAPHLMLLLVVTLAVAGLAALEAEGEVGVHRATAERALADYLGVVGREAANAAAGAVVAEATVVLAPAAGARASSPYEALQPPDALARASSAPRAALFSCPDGAPPSFVRLDLRDNSLAAAGAAAPSPELARWLRDTLAAAVAGGQARNAGGGGAMPVGVLFGRAATADRALVYGVKRAPFDAPVAVYAMVTCADALGAPLAARLAAVRAAALAPALADSLLLLVSADAALMPDSGGAAVAESRVGGLAVRLVRGPGAERRLVVRPGRGPRLALLGALAAVTATLVLVALAQLGREQELVRLRADFTSSVSHELRTPLAQILLYGETLALGRSRGEADRRAAAETIVREARRLMQMVENVLFVARAERRANGVRPATVALAPLAAEVAAGFAPLAAAAGASVAVSVPPPLTATAEPGALKQVLLNLLDNAVRYGPPGQTVRVGGSAHADVVRLTVDDEGPGVPARDRARIFAPFVRLARDRVGQLNGDAKRPGSGLGLAVVRELATLHGGRAWVEDAPGGRGARFVVELPAGIATRTAASDASARRALAAAGTGGDA